MARKKWFLPGNDDTPYKPFGIDCEGAATLYGHHGGWNGAATLGLDDTSVAAERNRAVWEYLNQQPTDAEPSWLWPFGRRRP
ncbi:hypothetical protein [Micromonospora sp. NPDC048830]|uniref:hypothetical protein n=1 Tax=Micromonospora sp. NPDC048830 TaxID=3364257 RepID=UPI0037116427